MSSVARKTLIFHIGDHKTGSTSIQTAFASGRVRLENARTFFPSKLSHNWLRDHCKAYASGSRSPARKKAINIFRNLAANIRQADAEFCLISGESLENIPASVFKDIVTRFFKDAADEIRVVAYVRPHPGRITSSYTERVKTGLPNALKRNLDEFFDFTLENASFVYAPRFRAWREHFGDNFILRPMIREQLYRTSVVDDFVRHVCATTDFTILEGGNANESLLLEDLMRLKTLQRHIPKGTSPKLRLAIGWEFARIVGQMAPSGPRTKLLMHTELAEKTRAAYLEDARAIDREFFDARPLLENELDRAVAGALPEALSTRPKDHLTVSELRSLEVLSRFIAGMLENDQVEWPAFLRNKRISDVDITRASIASAGIASPGLTAAK